MQWTFGEEVARRLTAQRGSAFTAGVTFAEQALEAA
jgi:hypothetical protein